MRFLTEIWQQLHLQWKLVQLCHERGLLRDQPHLPPHSLWSAALGARWEGLVFKLESGMKEQSRQSDMRAVMKSLEERWLRKHVKIKKKCESEEKHTYRVRERDIQGRMERFKKAQLQT